MAMKRETRDRRGRSPAELAKLRETRERFQREKPTLESLIASGEASPPIKHGEYLMAMQLAAFLKYERKNRGLTVQGIADAIGMDKSAISRLENGLVENPTFGTASRIASFFGKRAVITFVDEEQKGEGRRAAAK